MADRTNLVSSGTDLAYVTAELIDADGQVVYDSQRTVNFTVEGEGCILACGNACPNDMESFRNSSPKLYNGRAQAIVKTTKNSGEFTVKVTSDDMPAQTITLQTNKNQ